MGKLSVISGHSCVSRIQVISLSRLLMTLLWCDKIMLEGDFTVRMRFICVWKVQSYIFYSCSYTCICDVSVHVSMKMYVCMYTCK